MFAMEIKSNRAIDNPAGRNAGNRPSSPPNSQFSRI